MRNSLPIAAAFACLLAAAPKAQDASFEPAKKNAIYIHPGQISAMIGNAAAPTGLSFLWLQADYERFLQPGLSAIGGIQYFTMSPKDDESDNVEGGFIDVLAGVRWYPGKRFSGFYLQPQINYNRIFLSADDDQETWELGVNRFGVQVALGANGKWENITVDWNIGLSILSSPSTTIEKTDKETGITEDVEVEDEADELADYLLNPIMPTTSFSVGYQF